VAFTSGLLDGRDHVGLPFGPHTVSWLAHRARVGLHRAFVSLHRHDAVKPPSACQAARANLGAYVRVALSHHDTTRVSAHLECCRQCAVTYLEMVDVVTRPRPRRPPPHHHRSWAGDCTILPSATTPHA
jgi:hypothetical protein